MSNISMYVALNRYCSVELQYIKHVVQEGFVRLNSVYASRNIHNICLTILDKHVEYILAIKNKKRGH